MPDLGKYATAVFSAYGVAILLIAVLTIQSLIRGAKVRRDLAEIEKRHKKNG